MGVAVESKRRSAAIPSVMCPRCHTSLFLATAEPGPRGALILHFSCECGFEYRMSDASRSEYDAHSTL